MVLEAHSCVFGCKFNLSGGGFTKATKFSSWHGFCLGLPHSIVLEKILLLLFATSLRSWWISVIHIQGFIFIIIKANNLLDNSSFIKCVNLFYIIKKYLKCLKFEMVNFFNSFNY